MFRLGLEVIVITSTSSNAINYDNQVTLFRKELAGIYVVSLAESTFPILNDLAYYGGNFFVPDQLDSDERNGLTWTVDTLQVIYGRTVQYRAKILEISRQILDGWNNGTFQVDSIGSIYFVLYNLGDGNGLDILKAAIYSPSGEEHIIKPSRNNEFQQSTIPNITEVLLESFHL